MTINAPPRATIGASIECFFGLIGFAGSTGFAGAGLATEMA
jgi:hypothetical protein